MADTMLAIEGFSLERQGPVFDEPVSVGAIIGLAGLDGHGQDEFLETLAGLRPPGQGLVSKRSQAAMRPIGSFRAAAANGVVYLPRDRRTMGIFPNLSVYDNFAIASLKRDLKGLFISTRARRQRYETFRDQLSIVARDPDLPITGLSGGNQQKVLLARLLARAPDVLLLNDPTRGVDVATRQVLYSVFRQLADDGMTLVVLSSEIEEAVTLCDRLLVFREKQLAARLTGHDKTPERVIAAMFGRPS